MRAAQYVTIASILLACLASVRPASATVGDTATWSGTWNGNDLVVAVIARGHDIPAETRDNEPWWRWGNTSTDAYLFYWSEDQMIDLVLDFSVEDGHPVARLYVPTLQAQRQAITVGQGTYTLPEGLLPVLTLWPRDGDWLIDGKANFNLEGRELDQSTGQVDWSWRVGGEKPGVASWSVREVLPGVDPDAGYPHYQASMRMDPTVPFELATPVMESWPYLSAIKKEDHYGKVQPIFFDPSSRTIASNWAGFHIAGMYQINSINYPPYVDFESPFAFYRFDPDAELHPNLVIRSDIRLKHVEYEPAYETNVRMTWTADAGDLWRYSLTVAGNADPGAQVTIDDDSFYAVPYADYPTWITSKAWKAVTFVEATNGETGSEGIYDYSVEDNPPVTDWVNGLTTDPPVTASPPAPWEDVPSLEQLAGDPIATFHSPYIQFPHIHPLRLDAGFRGEYSLLYNRVPQLYFSTIDNRAHLLYAQEGVWNLGDGVVLRAHNLDGGPYINGWTRERVDLHKANVEEGVTLGLPGQVEGSLYALNGYLVGSDANTVVLKNLDQQPQNSDVPLPTDADRWRAFIDAAVPDGATPRDPNDLLSWVNAFKGDSLRIDDADISDMRATDNGFRFVLNLKQHSRVSGDDLLGMAGLRPGRYVVTFDGSFSIQPLTPPALSGSLATIDATQLQPLNLTVSVTNNGLQDVLDADLEIQVRTSDGTVQSLVRQPITILGTSTAVQTIEWAPWQSGQMTIIPSVILSDNRRIELTPLEVAVAPAAPVQPSAVISATSLPLSMIAAGIGLLAFVSIAGAVGWHAWKTQPTQRRDRVA